MAIAAITKAGRQKLCKAHAGNIPMSPIVKMVFGDGGLDTEGNVIPTTGEEVSLRNQLLEKEIETRTFLADDTKLSRKSIRRDKIVKASNQKSQRIP